MRLRRTMFGRWTGENGEGIEDIFFHSEGIDRTFFPEERKVKQHSARQNKEKRQKEEIREQKVKVRGKLFVRMNGTT